MAESSLYTDRPLPYQARLEPRVPEAIDLLVVHCTELPDLDTAREYGERIHYQGSRTGNSGHFYIDRDGRIECWVPVDRIAHHTRGYNPRSIGIELVNRGRWPDWFDSRAQAMTEPYPDAQRDALTGLIGWLDGQLSGLEWIAGHEDLDHAQVPASDDPTQRVRRKLDPGPMFPWQTLMEATRLQRFYPDRPL